jgi:hypothetical protein
MAFIGTPLDTRNTFQSLQGKRFNGDGSTTDFTLDVAPGSTLDIEVFVGNVRQDPNSAYTLSGTTLSFTGAPPSGTNNIYVVHQAKSVGTIDVPAGGVQAGSLATGVLTGQTDIGGAIADSDLFLVDDGAGGTLRKTAASRIKTYAGFDVSSITGATALSSQPAATDELILSDAGTLKRIDYSLIQNGWREEFSNTLSSDTDGYMDIQTAALFDTTYDWHCIKIIDADVQNDGQNIYLRAYFGGSLNTTSYYRYHTKIYTENSASKSENRSTGATSIAMCDALGNASGEKANGMIYYAKMTPTDSLKPIYYVFYYTNSSGHVAESSGVGYFANSHGAIDGFRIGMSGGGFGNVTVKGYGLKA